MKKVVSKIVKGVIVSAVVMIGVLAVLCLLSEPTEETAEWVYQMFGWASGLFFLAVSIVEFIVAFLCFEFVKYLCPGLFGDEEREVATAKAEEE